MGSPLANPTLVLGLGGFGREVCGLLLRQASDGAPANLVVLRAGLVPEGGEAGDPAAPREVDQQLEAGDEAGLERLLERVRDEARRLLELKHRVETTGAGDARPPRLDLFLVADLTEPGAAPLVPALVERIGLRLREEFRPIFRGSGGRLTISPILAVPRAGGAKDEVRAALDALDALARGEERRRPLGAIWLVEDQTSRYVLSRGELVRTVAAWLHLALYSGLRHQEDALKSLVEQDGDGEAPFASFACATLEFDTRPLRRYCVERMAIELAEAMLAGADGLGDVEAVVRRLSPEGAQFERRLSHGPNDKPIGEELALERAALELADPAWDETPEQIEARLEPYVGAVLASGERQRREIEDFKIESAARLVDEGGLDALRDAEREVEAELARCVEESGSGLSRGRARMAALEARLARLGAEARAKVERPGLPALPKGERLESAAQQARRVLEERPRLGRMAGWGAGAAALMAVFLAGAVRLAWRIAASGQIPFGTAGVEPEGGARFFAGLPWVAIWMGLLAAGWVGLALYRHYRDAHRRLLGAFEDLRRAAREHFKEIERYYAERIRYSRSLWAARVVGHLQARVSGERALLDAGLAALQKTRERLAGELEAEQAACGRAEEGVLFRGLLTGDDLAAIYEDKARPQNPAALARRYLDELGARGDWRSGEFAERDALVGFAERICPDLSGVHPFAEAEAWSGPARERAAQFLRQLAGKLSLPLELGVDTAGRSGLNVGFAPRECREAVEAVLRDDDLVHRWSVREIDDPRRMHLFVAVRGIDKRALKLLEAERGEG